MFRCRTPDTAFIRGVHARYDITILLMCICTSFIVFPTFKFAMLWIELYVIKKFLYCWYPISFAFKEYYTTICPGPRGFVEILEKGIDGMGPLLMYHILRVLVFFFFFWTCAEKIDWSTIVEGRSGGE